MKSEVYSWRLSRELKRALDDQARRLREPVAAVIERVVRDWLDTARRGMVEDEHEQVALHAAAARSFGRLQSGESTRSRRVREIVRARIARRRAAG